MQQESFLSCEIATLCKAMLHLIEKPSFCKEILASKKELARRWFSFESEYELYLKIFFERMRKVYMNEAKLQREYEFINHCLFIGKETNTRFDNSCMYVKATNDFIEVVKAFLFCITTVEDCLKSEEESKNFVLRLFQKKSESKYNFALLRIQLLLAKNDAYVRLQKAYQIVDQAHGLNMVVPELKDQKLLQDLLSLINAITLALFS